MEKKLCYCVYNSYCYGFVHKSNRISEVVLCLAVQLLEDIEGNGNSEHVSYERKENGDYLPPVRVTVLN